MNDSPVRIELGRWETMRAAAVPIRHAVFVEEQRVPIELELDAQDADSLHAVAFDEKGRAVGTGRLLPDAHIGRMAVLSHARGRGVGAALLLALMQAACDRGMTKVALNAQVSATGFYARYGFEPYGPTFLDAGIAHQAMERSLVSDAGPLDATNQSKGL